MRPCLHQAGRGERECAHVRTEPRDPILRPPGPERGQHLGPFSTPPGQYLIARLTGAITKDTNETTTGKIIFGPLEALGVGYGQLSRHVSLEYVDNRVLYTPAFSRSALVPEFLAQLNHDGVQRSVFSVQVGTNLFHAPIVGQRGECVPLRWDRLIVWPPVTAWDYYCGPMIDWAELADGLTGTLGDLGQGKLVRVFWAAVALSLVLPRLPYGRTILFAFALLGTWAHETGHGLTALAAGGSFRRLEIHRNLDGLAYYGGVSPFGRAVVAAGGLLAPAVAGGLVIVAGTRESTAPWILAGLATAVLISVMLFVRNLFGAIALSLTGLSLGVAATWAPELIRIFVAQLIGIQFCIASWGSLNYMFTKNFHRSDGTLTDSDTQTIANVLLLPYWFWGGIIAAMSLLILAGSFYLAWIYPNAA